MSQLATPASAVFRKSLREWRADYKARQTALAILTDGEAPTTAPPAREKRFVSRKRRALKHGAASV